MAIKEELNTFFVKVFYTILDAEEKHLDKITKGKVTLKEIHLIEAVFLLRETKTNTFSSIAKKLNITLGTLTTGFSKLEAKGYLTKTRDPRDKRVYYIEPTDLATVVNKDHTEFHNELIAGVTHTLNEKEQEDLLVALKKLTVFFNSFYELQG